MADQPRNPETVPAEESSDSRPRPCDPASTERDVWLRACERLAEACRYEREHTQQVVRLAMLLFDELQPLHNRGADDRLLLECAAVLHDIGWLQGRKGHHKAALRIILEATDLPMDERRRQMIAQVARYHRKALPAARHEGYAVLSDEDRRRIGELAALLRLADGLDRTHADVVEGLTCRVEPQQVTVHCRVRGDASQEVLATGRKSDLFEAVFARKLVVDTAPSMG
ncbi:MAG: HD domain-containing protein [Planctomycetes bacterium]|nr:HD domain-containing protein [Planctomycetota bacterium]